MAPALRDGDWVVVRRTRRVRPGDVIAAPDPRDPRRILVKRIAGTDGTGWLLAGDNPQQSTDSRAFGAVPRESVLGRVLFRYRRG